MLAGPALADVLLNGAGATFPTPKVRSEWQSSVGCATSVRFVLSSIETVTAAATSVAARMPSDFRVSITDTERPEGYPIASSTWLLVPARIADPHRGEAMKKFLDWMLGGDDSGHVGCPTPRERLQLPRIPTSSR